MRLRVRLVAGFVAVHLLLSTVAGVIAWNWLDRAQRAQAEQSAQAVGAVIAGGGFSLSSRVIERMRILTGYEFRVLNAPEAIRRGTVQVPIHVVAQIGSPESTTGEGGFIVEIDYRNAAWHAASRSVWWATMMWSLGGSAAFALVAVYLAGQFARPVERLASCARAIGTGAWDLPVPRIGSGEVAELARELDGMRQQLTALAQAQRQAERLATLGTFTATIAHEVRNPLSAVRLTVQMLAKRMPHDPGLELITDEIERLDLIVDELLAFSRGMTVKPQSIDPLTILSDSIRLLSRQAEHAGVELTLIDERTPGDGNWSFDPLRLRQLAVNLLLNAIQAAQQSSSDQPAVRVRIAGHSLAIDDNGPGVAADVIPHLFEAFRTTRSEGTGLGLHLARAIATAHGASLRHVAGHPGATFICDEIATPTRTSDPMTLPKA